MLINFYFSVSFPPPKTKINLNITFNTIFNPFKTLSIMVNTQQAQMQLDELKYGIIGLFKNRGSNNFELVTDVNDNDTIDVIRVTIWSNTTRV